MDDKRPDVTVEPETLSDTGAVPETRIGSAALVNAIVQRYVQDDQIRAQKRSLVDRMLAGSRPYDPGLLAKTGQSDRSNVPFREAEGHVEARLTTYFNLIFEPPCLVRVKVKDTKLSDHNYAGIIASKFHDMLMEWPGFVHNMLLHQKQMVIHAVGPIYFPDERDWHFKALRHGSFLVNSQAESTIDTFSNCVIRGKYMAHELFWKIYARPEELKAGITDAMKTQTAKEHGWNIDMVRRLIMDANKNVTKDRDDPYQMSRWESIQQEIKNGDTLYSQQNSDEIHVAHLLQREYRGKISWYIVPDNNTDVTNEYLYAGQEIYDDFTQAICLFFSGIGDGSYHSIQGMGKKIYSHSAINDRLRNNLIDAATLKSTMVIQSAGNDVSDVRKIQIRRYTVLPQNVKIVANAFDPDIKGTLAVVQSLENSLARNVGTERPDLGDHGVADKVSTALGERLRLSREGRLERSEIMLYYLYCDQLYREIKRRVFLDGLTQSDPSYDSVQRFKQACIDAGVPEGLLNNDAWTLSATRAVGFGSPAQSREIWDAVVSMAGYFPELGKVKAVKRNVSALIGAAEAEEIMPDDDTAQDPSNQESFAVIENSVMGLGGQVAVGKDQFHIAHLAVHFEPMEQIAQQFVSTGGIGANPMKTHDFFMEELNHGAQHLDFIKDDITRKPEYTDYMKRFDELLKVFNAISTMVKKLQQQLDAQQQAQQQAQAGGGDPEYQLKMQKMMLDHQRAQQKEVDMQQIREEKTKHTIELKNALANQKMILEAQKGKGQQ